MNTNTNGMDIFAGADTVEVRANTIDRENRQYLNQFEGTHRLRIDRVEISKTGKFWVREYMVLDSPNLTGLVADMLDMTPQQAWQRERALSDAKKFVGAALGKNPRLVKKTDLDAATGPESTILGREVIATVAPSKNPEFNDITYSAASRGA